MDDDIYDKIIYQLKKDVYIKLKKKYNYIEDKVIKDIIDSIIETPINWPTLVLGHSLHETP
jgi:hypothetical protein